MVSPFIEVKTKKNAFIVPYYTVNIEYLVSMIWPACRSLPISGLYSRLVAAILSRHQLDFALKHFWEKALIQSNVDSF